MSKLDSDSYDPEESAFKLTDELIEDLARETDRTRRAMDSVQSDWVLYNGKPKTKKGNKS
jgi:hypothetical protein